tara:strand:+ start:1005 stop:1187 length:183 start_codon:yes stop_codon:yes gene_type:complete
VKLLTEYEITKILNRAEIDYARKVKELKGDGRKFSIHAFYAVREIRTKINKYLDKKYENQ